MSISKYNGRGDFYTVIARYSHLVSGIEVRLRDEIVLNRRMRRETGYSEGTMIDIANAHRLLTGDDRVFCRLSKPAPTSTGISILIDQSGSMGGSKIVMARESAMVFSQVMENIGIPYEILGFTTGYNGSSTKSSHGRLEPVRHMVYKPFDQRLTPEMADQMAMMSSGHNNVDGEAVNWAYTRLAATSYKKKVMWVLSDGEPGCNVDGPHELFLRQVCLAIDRRISLVGIGYLDESVRDYYPKHVIVNDMNDLLGTFLQLAAESISEEK